LGGFRHLFIVRPFQWGDPSKSGKLRGGGGGWPIASVGLCPVAGLHNGTYAVLESSHKKRYVKAKAIKAKRMEQRLYLREGHKTFI